MTGMDTLTDRWKSCDMTGLPARAAYMHGAMVCLDLLRLGTSRAVLMAECAEFFAEPQKYRRRFDSAPTRPE